MFERCEDITECRLYVKGINVERVNEFDFLGNMFTKADKMEMSIKIRMNAGFKTNVKFNIIYFIYIYHKIKSKETYL